MNKFLMKVEVIRVLERTFALCGTTWGDCHWDCWISGVFSNHNRRGAGRVGSLGADSPLVDRMALDLLSATLKERV